MFKVPYKSVPLHLNTLLAQKRMRGKIGELEQALNGRVKAHHRFMLTQQLAHLEDLEEQLEAFNAEIERRMVGEEPVSVPEVSLSEVVSSKVTQ